MLVLVIWIMLLSLTAVKALSGRGGAKIILSALRSQSVSAAQSSDLEWSASAVSELFTDNGTDDEMHQVMLVAKSQYATFKDNVVSRLDNSAVETLKGVGIDLNKFPGPKVLKLGQQQYAMYDDQVSAGKVNFGGMFSQIKDKKKTQIKFLSFEGKELEAAVANRLSYAWTVHNYKLTAFKKKEKAGSKDGKDGKDGKKIVWPASADKKGVLGLARATTLFKNLVDSPALTVGPAELAEVAEMVAKEYGCSPKTHIGVETLCTEGESLFPQVAAVGMAAAPGREPRVVEWTWGDEGDREVVIIGKGITFDTGGLVRSPPFPLFLPPIRG